MFLLSELLKKKPGRFFWVRFFYNNPVSVSPLNVRLGQTHSLGLKVWGAQNIFRGQDFCFYYIF